ncbi:hypothetical protein G7Y79_00021g050390 [Physcia stellaris]|nr:hypothetical protein G7Y79_00021g050390 [Physcia stellaris]
MHTSIRNIKTRIARIIKNDKPFLVRPEAVTKSSYTTTSSSRSSSPSAKSALLALLERDAARRGSGTTVSSVRDGVKTSSGDEASVQPVLVEDVVGAGETGGLDVDVQEIAENVLPSEDPSPEFVVKAVGPAADTEERAEQPSPSSGINSTPPTTDFRGRPRAKSLPTKFNILTPPSARHQHTSLLFPIPIPTPIPPLSLNKILYKHPSQQPYKQPPLCDGTEDLEDGIPHWNPYDGRGNVIRRPSCIFDEETSYGGRTPIHYNYPWRQEGEKRRCMEDRRERVEATRKEMGWKDEEEEQEKSTGDIESAADLDEIDCHGVDGGNEAEHDEAAGGSRGDNDQEAVPAFDEINITKNSITNPKTEEGVSPLVIWDRETYEKNQEKVLAKFFAEGSPHEHWTNDSAPTTSSTTAEELELDPETRAETEEIWRDYKCDFWTGRCIEPEDPDSESEQQDEDVVDSVQFENEDDAAATTTPTRGLRRSQEWSGDSPTLLDAQDRTPSRGSAASQDYPESNTNSDPAPLISLKKESTARTAEQIPSGGKVTPDQVKFQDHGAEIQTHASKLTEDTSKALTVDTFPAGHEESRPVAAVKKAAKQRKSPTELTIDKIQARIIDLEREIENFKPRTSSHKTTANLNQANKTVHKSSSGKISKRKINRPSLSREITKNDQRIDALQAKLKAKEEKMQATTLQFHKDVSRILKPRQSFSILSHEPLKSAATTTKALRGPLPSDTALPEQELLIKRETKREASETPIKIESQDLRIRKPEKTDKAEMNPAVAAWLLAHPAIKNMGASKEIKQRSLNVAVQAGLSDSLSPQKSALKRTMVVPADIPGDILSALESETWIFAVALFNSVKTTATGIASRWMISPQKTEPGTFKAGQNLAWDKCVGVELEGFKQDVATARAATAKEATMAIELERTQTRCGDLKADAASKQSAYEALQADSERASTAFEKKLAQQRESSAQQINQLRREKEAAEAKAAEQSAIANQACADLANTKTELTKTKGVLDEVTKERDAAARTIHTFNLAVTRNHHTIDILKYNLGLLSDQGRQLLDGLAMGYEWYTALYNDNIQLRDSIAAGDERYAAVYHDNIQLQYAVRYLWNQNQEREAEVEDLNYLILDERKQAKSQVENSVEYERKLKEVIRYFKDELYLARQKNRRLMGVFREDHEFPFEDGFDDEFDNSQEQAGVSDDASASEEEGTETDESTEAIAEEQDDQYGGEDGGIHCPMEADGMDWAPSLAFSTQSYSGFCC